MAPWKLGPHVLQLTDAASTWCQQAGIVKAVGDVRPLQVAMPDIPTIYRRVFMELNAATGHFEETQDISRSGADVAQEILDNITGVDPEYIELFNEPYNWAVRNGLSIDQVMPDWIRINREGTEYLHRYGHKSAGFSFETGWPDQRWWQTVADAGFAGVDTLSLHAYWGNAGFTLDNALRHRQLHAWVPNHPPFIITECGRDQVEGGGKGWKASGISAEQYAGELLAYDAELGRDDYVMGATVFTAGPTWDWADFDVDGLLDLLGIGPLSVTQGGLITPNPTPNPTPSPSPGGGDIYFSPEIPLAGTQEGSLPLGTLAVGVAALGLLAVGLSRLKQSHKVVNA